MAPKHVLVVGAPAENFKNIDYLLEISGCRVIQAGDMKEVVDTMVMKKRALWKLDLILINDFPLLVQFMETFNGAVKLRERYPVIVCDRLNLKDRFRQMFESDMNDFNIRLCNSVDYLVEIEKALDLDFRSAVGN